MPQVLSAKLDATPFRFGLVASRFNEFITGRLLEGAIDALVRHGADAERMVQVWVPGSFEIPFAALKLSRSGRVDAVIGLGCLLRGQTLHFELIAAEVCKGLARVSLDTGIPVTFGVVTADTLEQAIDRAGAKAGNKGVDAALAAIEMAGLAKQLHS